MNSQNVTIMWYLLLLLGVLFAACNPCSDVTCINGSKEEDGRDCNCECDRWYSGKECDQSANQKFADNYVGKEGCSSLLNPNEETQTSYVIRAEPNFPNRLTIESLAIYIELTSKEGNFFVPKQNPDVDDFDSVRGSGSFKMIV